MVENNHKNVDKISSLKKSFQCFWESISKKQITVIVVFLSISGILDVVINLQILGDFIAYTVFFTFVVFLISAVLLHWQVHKPEKAEIELEKNKKIQIISQIIFCSFAAFLICSLTFAFSFIPESLAEKKDINKLEKTITEKTDEQTTEFNARFDKIEKLLKEQKLSSGSFDQQMSADSKKQSDELYRQAILDVADIPGIVEELQKKGGQAIIDHLLERIENGATGEGIREAHRKIAEVAYRIGNIKQAEDFLNIILFHKENDLYALNRLGWIYEYRGDLNKAKEQYQNLIKQSSNDKKFRAVAYNNIGNIYRKQAVDYSNKGNIYRKQGNKKQAMEMRNKAMEMYNEAVKMYNKALEFNEELGNKEGMVVAYDNKGSVYTRQGKLNQAVGEYEKSLKLNEELGNREGMTIQYGNMRNIYKMQGKSEKAKEVRQKSLAIFQELENH